MFQYTGSTTHENRAPRKPVADKDGWTTVSRRRRAFSLDSMSRSEIVSNRNDGEEHARAPPALLSEQTAAVDHAVQQLSQRD
ncbi:hypothetical protein MD484_g7086, partial [Candolleomyces efflorescens]